MLILPAIDIKGGNCVRLFQGDPDQETVYGNDPVAMARKFESLGAQLIHVVDLDGAFEGHPANRDLVKKIADSVSVEIEVGGGIRTIEDATAYIDAGIKRIILGTVVLEDEFSDFIQQYPENVIVGIDARDSMVATHGWKNISTTPAIDIIKELHQKGVREFIYTDISTDGTLEGPNMLALRQILTEVKGVSLIASGGVSSIDDILKLAEFEHLGLRGCIVGKAIYDGRVDLGDAIMELEKL